MMRSIKVFIALTLVACALLCAACSKADVNTPTETLGEDTPGTQAPTQQETPTQDQQPTQPDSTEPTAAPTQPEQQPTQAPTQQPEATEPTEPATDAEESPTEGYVPEENEGPIMPL